ncbi:uncharacterized protein LOC110808965 [Carica papaya]|uniref:uncharacterized protein LOC110808965 n=1 Tax=Carica papaya TaxID=3649 RepID=UPI000B8CF91F|nr:uncharacterized protein LOC110808965 [Carica papaya]
MPPTYFPLRWESTGDQWWYASPVDWAAANGHYDLVRELLRIDRNHLIKLTSLRRIRRLETVWDDEEQFDDVAKCRSEVAQKLFLECESRKGKNSLIQSGYGGWLMYTAASAGDLSFAHELLDRNPLLVFGEGEYGVTDILYAAARSKNCEVFRLIYDFAVSPRFLTAKNGEFEEHIGDIPSIYKWEMVNRAVHAAARGGNVEILKELLVDCEDVLAYRDKMGSTVLHAAAGRGQVEVRFLFTALQLISAGGIFGCQDYTARRAIASHLKMQGNGSSPGTSFRISDTEILLYTGLEIVSDGSADQGSGVMSSPLTDPCQFDTNQIPSNNKKSGPINAAAHRLKSVLHWPRMKQKKHEKSKKSIESLESLKKYSSDEAPTPLRQRFSKPSSPASNKRTLAVRSTQSSPNAKKKFASGIVQGVMQAMPHLTVPGRSRSSSFSKSSVSSPCSLEKQKGIFVDTNVAGPSSSINQILFGDEKPEISEKQGTANKKLRSQYFCFGSSDVSSKTQVMQQSEKLSLHPSILSMA